MKQRLKSALALLENDSIEQLVHHFLQVNHQRQRFDALLVSLLNMNENRLECYRLPAPNQISALQLDVSIGDINHPLVQIMYKGTPMTWESLNQGVRVDNQNFRTFIEELPHRCGLHAIPLFNCNGQACGVIAVFAEDVNRFADDKNMFYIYCHVMQHRLKKLQELEQLREQLRQIRQVFQTQRQKEKQLDELLASLSTTAENKTSANISHDYSKIDNLPQALEEFECAVLVQRQHIYGDNTKRIAESLGIAPRTLTYKLAKYRCKL
ncbi:MULTISPECIES: Fis family transcriptional regulator [Photorhabdus]|uniref:Uncharacterized protein n=2 Tax=Photorhabdus asymbiotica TaxID=291112 RepID=B6VM78_PHOAA|nr:Fis family transcriptional regulator [Photorhabdus asymbiotica]RKS54469.1 regulatory Fis family protein [Photorhabdus asymbiotica]CAQ82371.1 conserved hypothetical protein [Photorhabdus asymbiotica]CAR67258.1 Hypothetical Protein PA-RVA11-2313 [Photorhabdus asymbiotica subsp. asymbiotica ATCC 43949]